MANSMSHNGRKVTDELANLKLHCVPHSRPLPELSPYGFWLFGILKQNIKDRMFQTVEEIMTVFHGV
jgi:hypothetical protein